MAHNIVSDTLSDGWEELSVPTPLAGVGMPVTRQRSGDTQVLEWLSDAYSEAAGNCEACPGDWTEKSLHLLVAGGDTAAQQALIRGLLCPLGPPRGGGGLHRTGSLLKLFVDNPDELCAQVEADDCPMRLCYRLRLQGSPGCHTEAGLQALLAWVAARQQQGQQMDGAQARCSTPFGVRDDREEQEEDEERGSIMNSTASPSLGCLGGGGLAGAAGPLGGVLYLLSPHGACPSDVVALRHLSSEACLPVIPVIPMVDGMTYDEAQRCQQETKELMERLEQDGEEGHQPLYYRFASEELELAGVRHGGPPLILDMACGCGAGLASGGAEPSGKEGGGAGGRGGGALGGGGGGGPFGGGESSGAGGGGALQRPARCCSQGRPCDLEAVRRLLFRGPACERLREETEDRAQRRRAAEAGGVWGAIKSRCSELLGPLPHQSSSTAEQYSYQHQHLQLDSTPHHLQLGSTPHHLQLGSTPHHLQLGSTPQPPATPLPQHAEAGAAAAMGAITPPPPAPGSGGAGEEEQEQEGEHWELWEDEEWEEKEEEEEERQRWEEEEEEEEVEVEEERRQDQEQQQQRRRWQQQQLHLLLLVGALGGLVVYVIQAVSCPGAGGGDNTAALHSPTATHPGHDSGDPSALHPPTTMYITPAWYRYVPRAASASSPSIGPNAPSSVVSSAMHQPGPRHGPADGSPASASGECFSAPHPSARGWAKGTGAGIGSPPIPYYEQQQQQQQQQRPGGSSNGDGMAGDWLRQRAANGSVSGGGGRGEEAALRQLICVLRGELAAEKRRTMQLEARLQQQQHQQMVTRLLGSSMSMWAKPAAPPPAVAPLPPRPLSSPPPAHLPRPPTATQRAAAVPKDGAAATLSSGSSGGSGAQQQRWQREAAGKMAVMAWRLRSAENRSAGLEEQLLSARATTKGATHPRHNQLQQQRMGMTRAAGAARSVSAATTNGAAATAGTPLAAPPPAASPHPLHANLTAATAPPPMTAGNWTLALDAHAAHSAALHASVRELRCQLCTAQQTVCKLRQQAGAAQRSADGLAAALAASRADARRLEREVEQAWAAHRGACDAVAEAGVARRAAEGERDEARDERDEARDESLEVRAQLVAAVAEVREVRAEVQEVRAELDEARIERDEAMEEGGAAVAEVRELRGELDEVRAKRDESSDEARRLRAALAEAQSLTQEVRAELDEARMEYDESAGEEQRLRVALAEAQSLTQEARAELDEARMERDESADKTQSLRAALAEAQSLAERLEGERDAAIAADERWRFEWVAAQVLWDEQAAELDEQGAAADVLASALAAGGSTRDSEEW